MLAISRLEPGQQTVAPGLSRSRGPSPPQRVPDRLGRVLDVGIVHPVVDLAEAGNLDILKQLSYYAHS